MRPWLCHLMLGIGCLVLTKAPPARAEANGTFTFAWLAPAGCPSSTEVDEEIARLLGGPAHAPSRGDLRVRASVGHEALWLVTLDTTSGTTSGHRTISAASCEGLANATALIVALMIDPTAVAARSLKTEKLEPPPPPPSKSPESLAIPPAQRTTKGLAGVGAVGSLGALPSADLGIGVALGLAGLRWRVELRAAYSPRWVKSATMSDPTGAYGRFHLFTGMLAGCLTLRQPAFDWGPCVDFESGVVNGEGVGATVTSSRTTAWLGLGGGGFLAFRASQWLRFPVHIDAIVPLWRPDFTFRNIDNPIFRAWAVGGRMTAGVEVQF
jgi:hypothetical protein